MQFTEATALAKKNSHLIGKTYKGYTIDEVIVVPTDEYERDAFEKEYARTSNLQLALEKYLNADLSVFIHCDKKNFLVRRFMIAEDLLQLSAEYKVVKE